MEAIRPEGGVHRIGNHTRLHPVILHGIKQAAGTQGTRELCCLLCFVGYEFEESSFSAYGMVQNQQFACGIDSKPSYFEIGDGDLFVPFRTCAVVLHCPNMTGAVITVNVCALKVG